MREIEWWKGKRTRKKEEWGWLHTRNTLFEIVYDRALRQALLFSPFSFLPAVRGIRLRSVNILPPCSFSSSFIFFFRIWMNHEGIADRRPIQGCCRYGPSKDHRYVLFFDISFFCFYLQFIVLALLYLPYRTFTCFAFHRWHLDLRITKKLIAY